MWHSMIPAKINPTAINPVRTMSGIVASTPANGPRNTIKPAPTTDTIAAPIATLFKYGIDARLRDNTHQAPTPPNHAAIARRVRRYILTTIGAEGFVKLSLATANHAKPEQSNTVPPIDAPANPRPAWGCPRPYFQPKTAATITTHSNPNKIQIGFDAARNANAIMPTACKPTAKERTAVGIEMKEGKGFVFTGITWREKAHRIRGRGFRALLYIGSQAWNLNRPIER